jgi:hypothetical protein
MKALGIVPVGAPIDPSGAATAELDFMCGIAGRLSGEQTDYEDGEDFPLVTDKECLIQLVGPGEVTTAMRTYRFGAQDMPFVTLRAGKIVHVHESVP